MEDYAKHHCDVFAYLIVITYHGQFLILAKGKCCSAQICSTERHTKLRWILVIGLMVVITSTIP